MSDTSPTLRTLVEQRLGSCPTIFLPPCGWGEAALDIWLQFERGYLDNPIPPLLRERLMASLARLCDCHYLLVRHCAVLLGEIPLEGVDAQPPVALRRLLDRSIPTPGQLDERRRRLAGICYRAWPEPDTEPEALLIDAAMGMYLQPYDGPAWVDVLTRALGEQRSQQVARLVATARGVHLWSIQHRATELDPDLAATLEAHPSIAERMPGRSQRVPCDEPVPDAGGLADSPVFGPLNQVLRRMGVGLAIFRGPELLAANDLAQAMSGADPTSKGLPCTEARDITASFYLLDERGGRLPVDEWPIERARRAEPFSELQATVCARESGRSWTGVFSGHPLNVGGEPLFALTMRNVTHRVETEAALRRSEERLRLALASAHMGTWDFDIDAGAVQLDERSQEIFGLSGRPMLTFGEALRFVCPEDRAQLDEHIRRALHQEQDGDYDIEGRIVRADGQPRWVRAVGSVVFDDEGTTRRPHRFVGVIMDITRSKRADVELRQSEDRFREAFARAPIGMLLADLSGRFLHVNQAFSRIVGYDSDELIGSDLDLLRLAHPADAARSRVAFERVLAREIPGFFMEKRWQRKDGRFIWVRLSVSVRRGASGKPSQLVALVEDIDDRHRAEEELRWSEERLRRLAAGLEDQVAARTNSLKEYAERLQQLALDLTSAEQRERKRLAAILHDHIQQLLVATHMRLAAARRQTTDECSDLLRQSMELVEEAAESARDLTTQLRPPVLYEGGLVQALRWLAEDIEDKHGLHVAIEAEPIREPTDAVRGLVFEGVRELLFNVVKHAGVSEARVQVVPLSEEGGIKLLVSDEGMGFDMERAERGVGSTHGFGVFSVRERLVAFGGDFTLDSAPGQGVRVELTVPALRGQVAQRPDAVKAAPQLVSVDGGVEGIRVLLADDHRMVRDGLASILKRWSDIVVVGEASDGQEAIELTEVLRPQVVLMDVNMPRLSGIEATRAIKARWPGVSVFGLSVHAERAVARAMVEAGASGYFSKGVDSNALVEAIRRAAVPGPVRSASAV